jgi:hypothetical protein
VTLTGILSAAETTMYAKCFKHVKLTFDFFFLIVHPAIVMVDPELETGKRLPLPIGEHDDPSLDLTDGPVMVKVEMMQRGPKLGRI